MKNFFVTITTVFMALTNIFADATLPNFSLLSNLDGLPSDMINDICQDNLGFIWIGTDDGVARYDGYTIKVYDELLLKNNLMRRHKILSLAVDKDDMI
ncbi:MAG: two-component regulator propeller domain-containing protein [Rikenellaceae bacterium]